MKKNEEKKLNLNKINFNLNPKQNNHYSGSDQKKSEKSMDYRRTTEEKIIPEKNKIRLTKKLNSKVDIVKSSNVSFEDEISDSNYFPRLSKYKKFKTMNGCKRMRTFVNENRMKFPNLFKDDETGEKEEIEKNEEELEQKNLRQIFDKYFTNDKMEILQLIIAIICAINCILYVICTYKIKLFKYMNYFDIFVTLYLVFYNFIEIVLANHRLLYIISFNFFIHAIAMIPIIFCFLTDDYITSYLYKFVNACRVFRFHLITKNINYFGFGTENKFTKQMLVIVYFLLNIIFIISGLMQIVERTEIETMEKTQINPLTQRELKLSKHFHHYLYYTIVTLSTVGYGDIWPHTFIGKIIFIILDFMILALVPHQINDLIVLILSQSVYARNSYRAKEDIPHVLLVGNISTESLKSFCQEFFHPDHGSQYRHAVILNQRNPPRDMEAFLQKQEIKNNVFYLQGDHFNEKDLLRAEAHKAKACIIFNDKNSKYPFSGDQQSIILGTFIKKFVYNHNRVLAQKNLTLKSFIDFSNTSFRLCLQLNKPNSITHFNSCFQPIYKKVMSKDQLIIMETLKMNILSKSCITPGIMTLVTNLVQTSGDVEDNIDEKWIKEYADGRGHEIYRIQLKEYYHQFSFIEIVKNIYNEGQVICFSIEIEVEGVTILKLNPVNCADLKIKDLIEKGKKFNFKLDLCESGEISERKEYANTFNFNSKGDILSSFKSPMKRYKDGHKDNNVSVFAYLICADKSMADDVANKEKENFDNKKTLKEESQSSENSDEVKVEENDNNHLRSERIKNINIKKSFNNNINNINNNISSNEKIIIKDNMPHMSPKKNNINNKSQEVNNKGIFKELMKSMNNNLNMQMALIEKDSSSESEEDIEDENILQFRTSALEVNIKDYHIITEKNILKKNSQFILQQTIRNREDISNHIIICGFHPALLHFILPLRAKYLQEEELKWVIILSPSMPPNLLKDLTRFDKIIYIQGSPLLPEDLFRANINNAEKAVILSGGDSKINTNIDIIKPEDDNKSKEQNLDDETVLIYKLIKKCNKNIQIMTELIFTSNIEYLLDTDNIQQLSNQKGIYAEYEYTRLYASGEIFTPKIIDCLTCQSYYNLHLVNIIELLLGGQRNNNDVKVKRLEEYFGLDNSNLYLIKVPDSHINQAFMDYYYYLLEFNSIALALYRKSETDDFYYVYTNPKKTVLLRDMDYVFILSNNQSIYNLNKEEEGYNEEENNTTEIRKQQEDNIIKPKLDLFNSFDSSNDSDINANDEVGIIYRKETRRLTTSMRFSNKNLNLSEKMYNYNKNANFEKIRKRLNKIHKDLENIKTQFEKFPELIDNTIDKELDKEMKNYLKKLN